MFPPYLLNFKPVPLPLSLAGPYPLLGFLPCLDSIALGIPQTRLGLGETALQKEVVGGELLAEIKGFKAGGCELVSQI